MATTLNPYLNFQGEAQQALELYESVFGGDLTISRYGDTPGMAQDPAEADKVMHGQLSTPNGMTLMAADAPAGMPYTPGSPHSISLSGDDEAEIRGYWDKLSTSGQVTLPLEKAPWGDTFGMCTDQFGISWMFNIAGQAG
ncbi:VOC family protein [Propionibacteriaceae bacterium Y1700]|uniref:VOC family protein n=1 Tax=Microlunatus sp. Y1700 TaxID=3418487 RepID=UPI003DA72258